MSRVGKMPINVPKDVDVQITTDQITVKGAKATLVLAVNKLVSVQKADSVLSFAPANDSQQANAMSGTMRALVAKMVLGVSKGFERKLMLVGVGFRAQAQGSKLTLQVGFSHPVIREMPPGVTVTCPTPTEILIWCAHDQLGGQIAADLRAIRPPEPYKGKGIRYANERVVLKETKKK